MKNNNQNQSKKELPEEVKGNPEVQKIIEELRKSGGNDDGGAKANKVHKQHVEPKWR